MRLARPGRTTLAACRESGVVGGIPVGQGPEVGPACRESPNQAGADGWRRGTVLASEEDKAHCTWYDVNRWGPEDVGSGQWAFLCTAADEHPAGASAWRSPLGVCDNCIAMTVARHYVVTGRVQRVGFRFFVYEAGCRENISGWVRNLPDGRVEVSAEGDADAIERFDLALRRGPAGARVDEVETDIVPPTGRFSGFSVR